MRSKQVFASLLAALLLLSSTASLSVSAIEAPSTTLADTVQTGNASAGTQLFVTEGDIQQQGARRAIQQALLQAKENASKNDPYTITVAPGTYQLDTSLKLYSNTTLILTGVTLKADPENNVLRVGDVDAFQSGATGYVYENIRVEGGTLDGQKKSGTILKVGHTKNFTMENMTLQNAYNNHIMETGGVDGLNIKRCTFRDQTLDPKSKSLCYEAIQLDILYSSHLNGYRSETLATKNVTIDGCTFQNVPRGVGSHTSVLNQPMNKIVIRNCKFDHMKSAAIQGLNWVNSTIENNTITNSPRGIIYYTVMTGGQGTFLPAVLAKEGNTATSVSALYKAPDAKQKTVIRNNKITMNSAADPYAAYDRVGILVSGSPITTKTQYGDHSGNLPKGDYYANNVTVQGNTITTTGHGIRFVDGKNCRALQNTIVGKSVSDGKNYYGIQAMDNSTNVTIEGNTIRNAGCNGIYLRTGSSAVSMCKNTVVKTGKYGIDIEGAKAKTIAENKISNTKSQGIFVFSGGTVDTIRDNQISSTGSYGIQVTTNSTAQTITGNLIQKPREYGILVSTKSSGRSIAKNTITGAEKAPVLVSRDSKVTSVSSNYTLVSPKVTVKPARRALQVNWGKVSGATSYQVYRSTSKNSGYRLVGTTKAASYADKGLSSGKTYYYQVCAINGSSKSALSAVAAGKAG
ncbi:MAG: right-handed parallel beta-helix repeat-containing protein [Oscillospiraceae bacterium]|nr:right-handed parallel beta-helix repeat-containing protein [Oscillospiraceae bacterium]